jgi:Thiamine pyrophosphate enzyme, N-terminal TPP binding domain
MSQSVIEHVLSRLRETGINCVFGVAGDFAFPIDDAVTANRQMRCIGSCNELNAAYAADGYARIHGIAALCTDGARYDVRRARRHHQEGGIVADWRLHRGGHGSIRRVATGREAARINRQPIRLAANRSRLCATFSCLASTPTQVLLELIDWRPLA